jgi:cysteine desulfurase
VSAIEHSSVLEPARSLEADGFLVSRVLPDREGVVHAADVLRELREDTLLISLMHSSNEVGTLQPVAEVAGAMRQRGILVHTDAVQSGGKVPLDAADLGVDLLSLSAHKMGGPPGAGCLYVREGVTLAPLLRGGGQESNRRAGTEPTALIAGFAMAADLAASELEAEGARQGALRDRLEERLAGRIAGLRFHGRSRRRLPNTTCFGVEGCRGEEMVMALDLEGIAISTGSACAAGTVRPSHVLEAMGFSPEEARSTLRISLGRGTAEEDLHRLTECLARIVIRIRGARRGSLAPAGAAMKEGS